MAVAGRTATEILNKYFPGLDIGFPAGTAAPPTVVARGAVPVVPTAVAPVHVAPTARAVPAAAAAVPTAVTGVAFALPEDDERERDALARLTGEARADIARALGVAAPPRVVIRVHPSTASYERATGQPWFTSGATVGGELHLVPLASLRDRGVLDRTIRHQLVHLMADPALRDRPAWVREGAAIYFAGWGPVPGDTKPAPFSLRSRLPCPADADLMRPVSPGSLSNALATSLACFARQMDTGKQWRDVK
jgi:hypothetical protein